MTEALTADPLRWLGERAEIVHAAPGTADFEAHRGRAQGIVVRTYTRVDPALLDSMPSLRVVGRAGVGLDNIDLEACAERGVRVEHTPDANSAAVVEFVFALVLDAIRPRGWLDRAIGSEEWNALRADLVAPKQLAGSTLGVLGFGRIGSRVARVGSALGMDVIYYDLREIEPGERGGAVGVRFDELMERSDILTLHVDGRDSNRDLLGHDAFGRMKPDVMLVNTSRGFVVDSEACADFMRARPGAQALLDVHEPEPLPVDHPLLMMDNVYLTPHIASATQQAKDAMSWVVRDVWHALQGEPV